MFTLMLLISIFLICFYIVDALGMPLFITFLILKLCNVIAWSWVLVCIPIIVWGGCIILTILFTAINSYFELKENK